MVDFLGRIYRGFINFLLVLALIFNTILGFVLCGILPEGGYGFNFGFAVLGAVAAFTITFIIQVLTIPPLTILFSIDSKLDKLLKNDSVRVKEKADTDSADSKSKPDTAPKTGIRICRECGEKNPESAMSCKCCGTFF